MRDHATKAAEEKRSDDAEIKRLKAVVQDKEEQAQKVAYQKGMAVTLVDESHRRLQEELKTILTGNLYKNQVNAT